MARNPTSPAAIYNTSLNPGLYIKYYLGKKKNTEPKRYVVFLTFGRAGRKGSLYTHTYICIYYTTTAPNVVPVRARRYRQ